ncbi:MAG TPA: heme-binding protein [Pyrinomonadaceae bacterium]
MIGRSHRIWTRLLIVALLFVLLFAGVSRRTQRVEAQTSRPVLISEANSTRAVAFESVTQKREPFPLTSTVQFSADPRTRIMLFATNLQLQPGESPSAVTVEAEDGSHRIYSLTVEHVGPVPDQAWVTSIVVRLSDDLGDVGDVLVKITYKGQSSNRVRVGIGHTGGGPEDDAGAVPTPGSLQPQIPTNATAGNLSSAEVQTLIAQAVSAAASLNRPVTVAVVDREANVLGVFKMTGAPANTLIRGGGTSGRGLEGLSVPSTLAAISKAATPAIFSTTGNAFTTRTASFIVQEHIPPGVDNRPGGPLYGVQYSSLPCSDIKKPGLPLGLSADPGSMPIYKNGVAVGGIGIEGDGLYTLDKDPADFDQPFEEVIAVSAVRGFETPSLIRGDNILADGVRLPFINVSEPLAPATIAFGSLPGAIDSPIRPAQTSAFTPAVVGGIGGEVDTRFFPFINSPVSALTAADVNTIISHAAQQANITRAAIRQPLGSSARVSIAVVDTDGRVLGIFRTADAPVFGFDVSVQKARGAMFFSKANAGASLRAAGFGSYVDRAAADGLALNGSIAFTTRSVGFVHRPFFPDGINNTAAGPLSAGFPEWSIFNVGLQLDLIKTNLLATLGGASVPCTAIPELANGTQIFAGSVPLYKNNVLVGAIGISGDGIDQDDIIAAAGAQGFAPPAAIRADQFFVREVRLPFVKFPRSPNL